MCRHMVIFKRIFIQRRLRMIDFSMKLHGVWAISIAVGDRGGRPPFVKF